MARLTSRRALWHSIAWAEGCLVVAVSAVVFAVASSVASCGFLSGCEPGESSLGAAALAWLVVAGTAAVAGVCMASWTSGWPRGRVVVQAAGALLASALALWLGARASVVLVDEYLPALVLGVGVAAVIAIRPSSSRAIITRLVVLAVLVILAVAIADAGELVIGLALLALPSMGIAESLSWRRSSRVRQRSAS